MVDQRQKQQQHHHKLRHLRLKLCTGTIDLTSNWLERSYRVAQKLQERGEWPSFLTEEELPWLQRALETPDLWSRFITPRAEQWRLHAPPAAIFELTASAQAASVSTASTNGTGKRSAPQDEDGDEEMADTSGRRSRQHVGKRARAASTGMQDGDNDEELSAISESDIDMAMWTGDASLTSNVVTPSSLDGTPGVAATGKSGTGETLKAAEVSVVCAMAAFHARSAIFEQYVAVLCDSGECTQCTSAVSAHNDIDCIESQLAGETTDGPDGSCAERADEVGDAAAVEVPSVYETKPQAPLVSRSLDEDDDYDDDDDEDGDNNVGGSENKTESKDDAQKAEKDSSSSGSNSAEKTVAGVAVEFKASTQPSVAATNADAVAETSTNQPADTSAEDSGVSYRFALGGVFHTLDELAEAVHGQEVHEIHVQQIKDVALQRAAEPKDMLVNKIGALQNMKNLAQFIDNHRDSVNLSTRELSHLLSEVRPKRTKWANDRRIGQAELYDALEHTLHELKAMGEAAAPFLNQVKRKDAPDYYKVIKHPMDLGAMAKNLRNEAYDSKRQFADHLQLIRDNCYTYNTEPGNYYRRSVDALMAKAKALMENVPDIVVREKGAPLPPPVAGAATASVMGTEDAHTEFGDESGNESQGGRTAYGLREGSVVHDDGTPVPPGMLDASHRLSGTSLQSIPSTELPLSAEGVNGSGLAGTQQQQQHNELDIDAPPLSTLAHNILRATAGGAAASSAIADITEGYERPLGDKIWSTKARKQLAEYARRLEHDAGSEPSERHVPLRTSTNMRAFLDASHDTFDVIPLRDLNAVNRQCADIASLRTVHAQAAGAEGRRRNEELDAERAAWLAAAEDIDRRAWPFVAECEPAAGLPLLEPLLRQAAKPGVLRWLDDDCEAPVAAVLGDSPGDAQDARPSMDAYAVARFPDNAMWRDMADNVDRLRNIREIDGKIWAAKLNLPLGHTNALASAAFEPRGRASRADDASHASTRDIAAEYVGRPDPPSVFEMDAPSARRLLQRTSALLLAHAGFDSVTATSLSTITDFFIDYMTNLGRTLRTYMDKHSKTMSTEAILAHALYDNGTEDLVELEFYARGEVAKQANKLVDLQKKLARTYQEIMSDSRPDADAAADVSAFESGDAYMTGMVGGLGDLGDDFLGFKELGLDKEFGVEVLSVPQRLWYGRGNVPSDGALLPTQQEALAHPPPDPWPPIVSPAGQIGLMHQFICKKLKETNGADPPGYEGIADGEKPSDPHASTSTLADAKPAAESANMPDTWQPIPEEESLPQRLRYGASRPKVPPPNYLTHPKTHMHVGSGQVATPARAARKRPAKTTANKTTGLGAKKKSAGASAPAVTSAT